MSRLEKTPGSSLKSKPNLQRQLREKPGSALVEKGLALLCPLSPAHRNCATGLGTLKPRMTNSFVLAR